MLRQWSFWFVFNMIVPIKPFYRHDFAGIQGEDTLYSWFRTTYTVPSSLLAIEFYSTLGLWTMRLQSSLMACRLDSAGGVIRASMWM